MDQYLVVAIGMRAVFFVKRIASDMEYEQPRLLLVQHDQQAAAIVGFRLELLGYDVTHVSLPEDVAMQLESIVPDLALVDTRPSGIDGLEVIGRIRTADRTAHVPILACSPDSSPHSVQEAFVAGANDYLIEPFDPATLESKVEALLASESVRAEHVS